MIGRKFGRLTVLRKSMEMSFSKRRPHWKCRCDCGIERIVSEKHLKSGNTKSCGCLNREITSARSTTHGHSSGGVLSPTYSSWTAMVKRCHCKGTIQYARYGAKGIRVCSRWRRFENFLSDMGPRPPGTSIDRKNNKLGYSPKNCRWATSMEQGANTKRVRWLTLDGKRLHLAEWARLIGVTRTAIYSRLKRWPKRRALTEPPNKRNP